jgi:hypothetical protein
MRGRSSEWTSTRKRKRRTNRREGRLEMTKIAIHAGGVSVEAELFDTETARDIAAALPLEAEFSTWGDEFYFPVPVKRGLDDTARTVMEVGDLGYWPPRGALAVFFGPTPASIGGEPVAASEVNVVGRILGDAVRLKSVKMARTIRIERI